MKIVEKANGDQWVDYLKYNKFSSFFLNFELELFFILIFLIELKYHIFYYLFYIINNIIRLFGKIIMGLTDYIKTRLLTNAYHAVKLDVYTS